MADVTLSIGGRSYTVACRDGGETHLSGLAARVDAKVVEARAAVGTTNEVRQLLFAALLLADEATGTGPAAIPDGAGDPDIERALATLAQRIEAIADTLESAPANP